MKKNDCTWSFSGALSSESKKIVARVQAQQLLDGNDMTKIDTVDFIIKSYGVTNN